MSPKASIYVDGHERADVVEAHGEFLKTMTSLGFLNRKNILNEGTKRLLDFYRQSP